jgi:hypothetical protein
MGAVQQLCRRALLLQKGQITADGDVISVINKYLTKGDSGPRGQNEFTSAEFCLSDFKLSEGDASESSSAFRKDSSITLTLDVDVIGDQPFLHIGYALYPDAERPLWWSFFGDKSGRIGLKAGRHRLKTHIPPCLLNDGDYSVEIIAGLHGYGWLLPPHQREVYTKFSVQGGSLDSLHISAITRPGFLMATFDWEVRHCDSHFVRV